MFLVEEALFQILSNAPTISSTVFERIFPTVLQQNTDFPALVYRQISGEHIFSLLGSSGLKRSRFRIFSTARQSDGGYSTVKRLDENVRLALQGFAGQVINANNVSESLWIQDIQALVSHDLFDDPTQTFQVATDYDIWVTEDQPVF